MRKSNKLYHEKYALERSPLCCNPTQRDLATLLASTKTRLEALIRDKEAHTVRRDAQIGAKMRKLIYPKGKLRVIHERLRYQLDKIRQPDYMLSPRKGRSQRHNAMIHQGSRQFLQLDVRQFYPSTTAEHVFRWAKFTLKLRDDVAGLIVKLTTIEGRVFFGSPLTPVLSTLVHRKMFDEIALECKKRGLKFSIWVDDINISGNYITARTINVVRDTIARYGLKSHKLELFTGNRPVRVTGISVFEKFLDAPYTLHRRIMNGYTVCDTACSDIDAENVKLLSSLGVYRHIVGRETLRGQMASNRMNTVRRRWRLAASILQRPLEESELTSTNSYASGRAVPWE